MKENILLFFKCKISLTKAFDLEQHRQDFRDHGRTEPNHCTGLMKTETAPSNYQQDNLQSVMHGHRERPLARNPGKSISIDPAKTNPEAK
jgi:hypothetical protein